MADKGRSTFFLSIIEELISIDSTLSGIGCFCPLDELSTAGLVNYFGRLSDINRGLELTPVLLKKEINGKSTTIALYGVSAMKDERLFKLLYEKKVRSESPVVAEQ